MSAARNFPLPAPPTGFRLYRSEKEIRNAPELFAWQHLLLHAWEELGLCAVLTCNHLPTVYVRRDKHELTPAEVASLQCRFWNQGIATILLLCGSHHLRVISAMAQPVDAQKATPEAIEHQIVETIGLATQAAWVENFYTSVLSGQYYNKQPAKFDPAATVDAWLMDNLEAVRDKLTTASHALKAPVAHAFLGRILFTSYLCHRGIITLADYFKGRKWKDLREMFAALPPDQVIAALYSKLFPALKKEFNSSMFDEELASECSRIKPRHIEAVREFLDGSEVRKGQGSLGFWAYDFSFIPVETISAIYEKFLKHEDEDGKRALGAFYTPRLLAELTLDQALHDRRDLHSLKACDPACGSGIFLVLLFNRLAAAWASAQKSKPSPDIQAKALRGILGQLRGVDRNATACRIACFSLYLAFLNQFDPAGVRPYMQNTGEKLPNLLVTPDAAKPDIPVIWERDFLETAAEWQGQFNLVIGNPPWAERGSKQLAYPFMEKAPGLLEQSGVAAYILPSKVFFNQTDDFQARWLRAVTVESVIQLADFRRVIFKEAKCPAAIVRFTPKQPPADHVIEYVTPKVQRTDLRDGMFTVSPQDRKWIPLSRILQAAASETETAGMIWKSRLWGTPRDQKLLDYLSTLPRLGEIVSKLSEESAECPGTSRWITGQGCKPWNPKTKGAKPDRELQPLGNWADDPILPARAVHSLVTYPTAMCPKLGDYFKAQGYPGQLYSKPPEALFRPPLVLLSQGFSQATFLDDRVRFQHTLQSITARHGGDADALMFLCVFLRSPLARYFVFHTAVNIGTERDKVHLDEALMLPFFLPDHAEAPKDSAHILKEIATAVRKLKTETERSAAALVKNLSSQRWGPLFGDDGDKKGDKLKAEWFAARKKESLELQESLNARIYEYFGLTHQDIALVEDTCDIFDKSDTPGSLQAAAEIPTLLHLKDFHGLSRYADMICGTLNGWASGAMRVSASGAVDQTTGLAVVELRRTRVPQPFEERRDTTSLTAAMQKLQEATRERRGGTLEYQRDGWYFDGTHFLILKPARMGEWTRTAALNDAAEIYAHLNTARQSRKS